MKIVVVGSSNIDMIARVHHLPAPGETVGQARFMQVFGGKGANQAVTAARLGGDAVFVTSLGNDMYAEALREHFGREGISTDYILTDEENPTGTALIFVDDRAENCIAVAPGANGSLLPDKVGKFSDVISGAGIVLMQAEIPYDTIRHVARMAKTNGVKVMFNPAPACGIDPEMMSLIDILVVNETEAQQVSGLAFADHGPEQIAAVLMRQGARSVVITLGEDGSYLRTCTYSEYIPSYEVSAVDTTAAGDVFCGALAVVCSRGELCPEALVFASAAAAIAVTRLGAQPSIPQLDEVFRFLKERDFTNLQFLKV